MWQEQWQVTRLQQLCRHSHMQMPSCQQAPPTCEEDDGHGLTKAVELQAAGAHGVHDGGVVDHLRHGREGSGCGAQAGERGGHMCSRWAQGRVHKRRSKLGPR